MALARDASSSGFKNGATGPLDFAHTNTGSDLLLLVGVQCQDDSITGVTYNSVALTQIRKKAAGGGSFVYMYGLRAPATGANTVSVAFTGSKFMRAIAVSYTGFLGDLPDASNDVAGTDTVTSQAITITTIANNCWFAAMVYAANVATAITASGGGTSVRTEQANTMFMDSNGALTPAGLKSMTADFNANSSGERAIVGVSVSPTAASSTGAAALLLFI